MLAAGTEYLVYVALLLAVAASALILTARKPRGPASDDDRAQNYATRGTYIPLGIGQGLYGAVHIWSPEGAPIGYGNPPTYRERGLHAVAIGPANGLWKILKNGKSVWPGPADPKGITPETHPSGTAVVVPDVGTFKVYWGFQEDPPLTILGTASNHGVPTRYPLVFKILWDELILGPTQLWPRMEYVCSFPCYSTLGGSPVKARGLIVDGGPQQLTWRDWVEANPFQLPLAHPTLIGEQDNPPVLDVVILDPLAPAYAERQALVLDLDFDIVNLASFPPSHPMNNSVNLLNRIRQGDVLKVSGAFGQVFMGFSTLHSFATDLFLGSSFDATGSLVYVANVEYPPEFWTAFRNTSTNLVEFLPIDGALGVPPGYALLRRFGRVTRVTFGQVPNIPVLEPVSEDPLTTPKIRFLSKTNYNSVNPVHAIHQLLFCPFPYGAGTRPDRYNKQSMQEAASFFAFDEPYRCSLALQDGETAADAVERICQDAGILISLDPSDGLYAFVVVRHPGPATALPLLPDSVITKRPSVVKAQGRQRTGKAMYVFKDGELNYRDQPISFDDDGKAFFSQSQGAQRFEITTTEDFYTALAIGTRRSQEILSSPSGIRLKANRATRLMFPGLSFRCSVAGNDVSLLLTKTTKNKQTGEVELEAVLDNYAPPVPSPSLGGGEGLLSTYGPVASCLFLEGPLGVPTAAPTPVPSEDQAQAILEIPWDCGCKTLLAVLRLRQGTKAEAARLWLSANGAFSLMGTAPAVFGGTLETPLSSNGPAVQDSDDVTIFVSIPEEDDEELLDLDADRESFLAGLQLALIGNELCFVSRVIHLSGSSWSISQGLIRGRFGTTLQDHPVGTPVFIFQKDSLRLFNSSLMSPGRELEAKIQPTGQAASVTLSQIPSVNITIKGKAPLPVKALRASSLRSTYSSSEDVSLAWCHSSPARAGLGQQGLGELTFPSEETFILRFHASLDLSSPVREEIVLGNTFTYTEAMRIADSLESGWTVEVLHKKGGLLSASSVASFTVS